jgi:hypothetical protein
LAVQILVEFDVTEVTPSPVVVTTAVNPPPSVPLVGKFEMVGTLGIFGTGAGAVEMITTSAPVAPTAQQLEVDKHDTPTSSVIPSGSA